jgi:hypothetical protein
VVLQHSVTAGKTPVGSKVEAKLSIATLFHGTVIPRNATFSGEVVESVARKGKTSSRLAIRMTSVAWKDGSASVQLYLTPWYYPSISGSGQDLQYGPEQAPSRTWNGEGAYPDPNSRSYKPFPQESQDKDKPVPDTPSSVTSKRRVLMKNVQTEHSAGDVLVLVSNHENLKLERFPTYVLAAGDLLPSK